MGEQLRKVLEHLRGAQVAEASDGRRVGPAGQGLAVEALLCEDQETANTRGQDLHHEAVAVPEALDIPLVSRVQEDGAPAAAMTRAAPIPGVVVEEEAVLPAHVG